MDDVNVHCRWDVQLLGALESEETTNPEKISGSRRNAQLEFNGWTEPRITSQPMDLTSLCGRWDAEERVGLDSVDFHSMLKIPGKKSGSKDD